jgi:hypothetical protein
MSTRRQLDELITLYELEPSLREVITEGRTDASLLAWFLEKNNNETPVFALTDRLEVPRELVEKYELDVGERGRALAAATYVERSVKAGRGITFVIDSDFDHAFPTSTTIPTCVLATDYANMECYCYDPDVVEKFIRVGLRGDADLDGTSFLGAIEDALVTLFVMRWLLKNLPGSPGLVERIERRCRVLNGQLVLDQARLITDSLNACRDPSARTESVTQLERTLIQEKEQLSCGVRSCVHGHDFVRLLTYYISTSYASLVKEDRRAFRDASAVAVGLRLALDMTVLAREPMFVALLDRVA